MPNSIPQRPILTALSFFLLAAASAAAFCGLQSCPRPAGRGETPRLEAALRTRAVSYDIAGNEGHYLVTAPRVFVNYGGLAVGAEIPITRLDNGGAVATGFSNPVVMARFARRLSYAWSAEAGLQWELPLGDRGDGLAGDHHMVLPWIGLRRDVATSSGDVWYATGMGGYSTAIVPTRAAPAASSGAQTAPASTAALALPKTAHAGHDHGAAPVLVNPHADQEMQGRAAIGWVRGRGTLEGFALAQTDLSTARTGTYARAGASYEWSLGRFTGLQVIGDLPVTAARRNDAEVGLTVKTGI